MRAKLATRIIPSVIDHGNWDMVAVARHRMARAAVEALVPLGKFRPSGYPRVLIGLAGAGSGTLAGGMTKLAELAGLNRSLVRVQALERVVPFERADVTEALCLALDGAGHRFAGKSFHVRSRLRGMKGRLESPAVERALGAFLFERAAAVGEEPRISFDDPDLIVAIEVIGRRVGYAILDRDIRGHELVRVR